MTNCTICGIDAENDKIRHHDIYVIGSEGVWLCHKCEMDVVNYLRVMQSVATRSKLDTYKRLKRSVSND